MNFREITDKVLALAVKKINHRPRKCLNYQTPHEVYCKELHGEVAT
jgi:IS30 family transposase